MNKLVYIALFLGLFACKKERLGTFSEEEVAAIHLQHSSLEIITKLVAYHELIIQGGLVYNQGAIVRSSDTVGTWVYDTLKYNHIMNNPYVHSLVAGYSCSERDTSSASSFTTIHLDNFVWNGMSFSGSITYNYNTLALVTIDVPSLSIETTNQQVQVQGVLFANKSTVNHTYTGYLNGSGDCSFQWNTTEPFVCFGDYSFSDINSIPNGTLFIWKTGAANLTVANVDIQEKIDETFYQINKVMILHPNGLRRIYEYPFF